MAGPPPPPPPPPPSSYRYKIPLSNETTRPTFDTPTVEINNSVSIPPVQLIHEPVVQSTTTLVTNTNPLKDSEELKYLKKSQVWDIDSGLT
jgi:hypothetical protein